MRGKKNRTESETSTSANRAVNSAAEPADLPVLICQDVWPVAHLGAMHAAQMSQQSKAPDLII